MSALRVFIAYSGEDSPWVGEFGEAMSRELMSLTLRAWEIPIGESSLDAAEAEFRNSDAIVAVISLDKIQQSWMFFFYGAAVGAGKLFIPIVSEDVPESAIPPGLGMKGHLEKGSPEEAAEHVVAVMGRTYRIPSNREDIQPHV